jgi:hypothetical protein
MALGQAAMAAAPGPLTYGRVDLVATPDGPALMELELIEPFLFLDTDPAATLRFAAVLAAIAVESRGL